MFRGVAGSQERPSFTALRTANWRGIPGFTGYVSNQSGYDLVIRMKKLDLQSIADYSFDAQIELVCCEFKAHGVTTNETCRPHLCTVYRLRRCRCRLGIEVDAAYNSQPPIGHSEQPGSALCPWTAWLPGRTVTTVYAKVMPRKCHRFKRNFRCGSGSQALFLESSSAVSKP